MGRRIQQGCVQQAWTSSLAGDRGYAALACSAKRSSAFCKVLYSKPRKAFWAAIVDMPRSLAWKVIQRFQQFSVKQRLLLLTDATRSSFNLICSSGRELSKVIECAQAHNLLPGAALVAGCRIASRPGSSMLVER